MFIMRAIKPKTRRKTVLIAFIFMMFFSSLEYNKASGKIRSIYTYLRVRTYIQAFSYNKQINEC